MVQNLDKNTTDKKSTSNKTPSKNTNSESTHTTKISKGVTKIIDPSGLPKLR